MLIVGGEVIGVLKFSSLYIFFAITVYYYVYNLKTYEHTLFKNYLGCSPAQNLKTLNFVLNHESCSHIVDQDGTSDGHSDGNWREGSETLAGCPGDRPAALIRPLTRGAALGEEVWLAGSHGPSCSRFNRHWPCCAHCYGAHACYDKL